MGTSRPVSSYSTSDSEPLRVRVRLLSVCVCGLVHLPYKHDRRHITVKILRMWYCCSLPHYNKYRRLHTMDSLNGGAKIDIVPKDNAPSPTTVQRASMLPSIGVVCAVPAWIA